MKSITDDHRIARALVGSEAAAELAESRRHPSHIHDFNTGRNPSSRCTICQVRLLDAGLQAGGKSVGPSQAVDDDYRAPTAYHAAVTGKVEPRPDLDRVPLNRMDVVAYGWALMRRPGEDDDHLAVRIRRAAANKPYRPTVPPMDWVPPKGYKLGDSWTVARGPNTVTINGYAHAVGVGETYEESVRASEHGSLKRVN
jgi:hypothetical protein